MNYKQISHVAFLLGAMLSILGIVGLSTRIIFGSFYLFLISIYANIETVKGDTDAKQ